MDTRELRDPGDPPEPIGDRWLGHRQVAMNAQRVARAAEELRSRGWAVLRRVLSAEQVAALQSQPWEEPGAERRADSLGSPAPRSWRVPTDSLEWRMLAEHELPISLAKPYVRPQSSTHRRELHRIDPVRNPFTNGWHVDVPVLALWAVDDFTLENGATQIVGMFDDPASAIARQSWTTITTVAMPAGSLLVMRASRVVHRQGINTNGLPRRTLAAMYA